MSIPTRTASFTFTSSVPAAGTTTGSQRVSSITFRMAGFRPFPVSGQLKLVSDSSGYAILFEYNGIGTVSPPRAASILPRLAVTAASSCTGAALVTRYSYSSSSGPDYVLTG